MGADDFGVVGKEKIFFFLKRLERESRRAFQILSTNELRTPKIQIFGSIDFCAKTNKS